MCIRKVEERKNLVWIPYTELLASSLPADRGSDNRMTTRLYTFLKIVALARDHLRKKLICGSEIMIIADIKEDLHEALHLTQNIVGIPIFKMQMFKRVFISAWNKLGTIEAQNDRDFEAGVEGAEKRSLKKLINGEKMMVLTAHQLCQEFASCYGRTMTTANMKRTYLDEFVNAGLIDEEEFIDGRKTKVWYPIVDLDAYNGKSEYLDTYKMSRENELDVYMIDRIRNITQHHKLLNHGQTMELDENWLEQSIFQTLSVRTMPDRFEIYDENNERMCLRRFTKEYENAQNGYFKDFFASSKYVKYGLFPIYPNEIFQMKPLGKLDSLEFFTNRAEE